MAICRLTSRNGNEFKSFPELNDEIPDNPSPHSAIFDAEIVCLDGDGKPQFLDLQREPELGSTCPVRVPPLDCQSSAK
jgi:ATP-dependent DNA ligase